MRKINAIICMLLVFALSNVHAQSRWEYASDNATEIFADDNHYYALRRGFTKKPLVEGFLNSNSNKITANFDNSCVYKFIEVGTKESAGITHKVYVLQNISNKMYICTNGTKYTASVAEAFRFTARKAKLIDAADKTDWEIYSQSVLSDGCAGAEPAGTWVFCNPDRFQFLSFEQNKNPGFNSNYIECTNWFVLEAKPMELTPFEKFLAVYEEHISTHPLSEEFFPIGTDPGCISAELYNKMSDVYAKANEATRHQDMTKEQCEEHINMILSMVDEYNKNLIQVEEGKYYVIKNELMGFTKDNGKPNCDGTNIIPDPWTVDDAKYIWLADSTSAEGGIFFKNIITERYLGKQAINYKPQAAYTTKSLYQGLFGFFDGNSFVISIKRNGEDKGNYAHGGNDVPEGQWRFIEVKKNIMDSLQSFILQEQMNSRLKALIRQANNNISGLQYENGITYDGKYVPSSKGLVKAFEACNSVDTREGSKEENAFDGNISTFFHTLWNSKAPTDDWAWVQVDLGTELQEIVLKMTKRAPHGNASATKIGVFAAQNDNLTDHIWTEKLSEDTIIYSYETMYADTLADSCTFIGTIKFSRPARHIRLTALNTVNNKIWGFGPTWSVAEMRFYNPAECVENPKAKLIPAAVMNNLKEWIAKAETEIGNGLATQETYDALSTALDEMWAAYPDPSELMNQITIAEERMNTADETYNGLGFYRPGAKQKLQTAIDAIKKDMENKVLTLEDIARLEADLDKALKEFNSMLIAPEPGIYTIMTASLDKVTGEPDAQYGAFISSTHADYKGDIYWKYKDDKDINSRWNTLWSVEKNEDGKFAFKNLVSGLYIENPYEGLSDEEKKEIGVTTHIHLRDTPTYFDLQASPEAGKFIFELDKGRYMNASGVGHMAIWSNRDEQHSRYQFQKVDINSMTDEFKIDCEANKYQIFALPIAISFVTTNNGTAYKVLGVKDNAIQLAAYGEEETINAGVPFIIKTVADENSFIAIPLCAGEEEWINGERVRSAQVQNGMVSAPTSFTLEPGFGILFSNTVMPTIGGENVQAGTGFFNNSIPTTTENGDLSIELKGDITGEGTAVENVVVEKNVAHDVYTVTGVKVRHNVHGAAATEGLPQGIYIVGGKKVYVK